MKHVAAAAHHDDEIGEAGRVTAPPAHGPSITLICGTTPLACVLRQNRIAEARQAPDAFLIRAPDRSSSATTGKRSRWPSR